VTACAVFGQAALEKNIVLENIAKNITVQSQILDKNQEHDFKNRIKFFLLCVPVLLIIYKIKIF